MTTLTLADTAARLALAGAAAYDDPDNAVLRPDEDEADYVVRLVRRAARAVFAGDTSR